MNSFDGDWFKTGDIGNIDADGFLSVTDRKKNLIKTSGGKFIAPQPIENSLKRNPLIAEAAVIGDRRRFPAVLIAPMFERLEDWARQNHVLFNNRAGLVQPIPRVQALYEEIVGEVNQNLARYEKLKKCIAARRRSQHRFRHLDSNSQITPAPTRSAVPRFHRTPVRGSPRGGSSTGQPVNPGRKKSLAAGQKRAARETGAEDTVPHSAKADPCG